MTTENTDGSESFPNNLNHLVHEKSIGKVHKNMTKSQKFFDTYTK